MLKKSTSGDQKRKNANKAQEGRGETAATTSAAGGDGAPGSSKDDKGKGKGKNKASDSKGQKTGSTGQKLKPEEGKKPGLVKKISKTFACNDDDVSSSSSSDFFHDQANAEGKNPIGHKQLWQCPNAQCPGHTPVDLQPVNFSRRESQHRCRTCKERMVVSGKSQPVYPGDS